MSALTWVAFVVAAMIGAPLRYLVDQEITRRTPSHAPWGTWVVNVTGTFVLGLVTGLALYHGLGHAPRAVLGTGFCGAYTTFSTFTFETVRLAEEDEIVGAARNVVLSLAAGALAATAGIAVMAW